MSKRGPLSKIEKFYIQENLDAGVDALSTDLDRAKSVVKAYADKCKPKVQVKETHISEQIFSNKRGSTVMTETGSMLSDDFKKSSKSRKRPKCVTPIKG
jgi:hypothetical protein